MAPSQVLTLVRQCLHQRIPPDEFDGLLALVTKKWNVTSTEIVANLIKSAFEFCSNNDPLLSGYLQIVLTSQRALVSDFLALLIMRWQKGPTRSTPDVPDQSQLLAVLLTDLTIAAPNILLSESEIRKCMVFSARWLKALFDLAASSESKHSAGQINMLVNASAVFLITLMNIPNGTILLKTTDGDRADPLNLAIRQAIDGSMDTFPDISMQLLGEAQKHPALIDTTIPDTENAQVAEMAAMQFANNLHNAPNIPARIATYVYLYTKLLNSTTIDETALYHFLDTRHARNHGSMFNELLFASFDVLSKPTHSQDPLYQAQCRIFLHNKLPATLALITSLEPLPTEQYLQELWNDLNALGHAESLTAAKHFLNVCVLHHLISANAVQQLTGDDPNNTSAKGLFPKHALVEQVRANATRGPRLVDELTKNDGNVGAIGQAVVDVMHKYCEAKETQHLKDMANALVRQPSTINAITMFVRPSYFLSPICRLLDEWTWDDIHGESQPIYEEFGSILLLLLTVKFRLHISNEELGFTSTSGFVAQYLSSSQSEAFSSSSSSGEQQKQLGDWIENLYFEEGLSDDVTTNCSARDFYLMIPALLRQSMTAFTMGKLSQHKLEQGLDYLREPFLLASLLSSFAWLARAIQKDSKGTKVILQRLVQSPDNQETNRLHRTILDIAAGIFHEALSHLPDQALYSEVVTIVGEYKPFAVNPGFKIEDLSLWESEDGGINAYLQRATSDLLTISSTNMYQPNILLAAVQIRGPNSVIHDLVHLLTRYSANHEFPQLLDLTATIIASTDTGGVRLRQALQLLHAKLGKYLKKGENIFAEVLVHLHRRVEIYSNALTPQPGGDDQEMMQMGAADMAEINLDQMPMDTEVAKQQVMALSQPDQLLGEDMDQMLNEAANMGTIDDYNDGGNDENMFNLDNYELTDLGDLDLEGF